MWVALGESSVFRAPFWMVEPSDKILRGDTVGAVSELDVQTPTPTASGDLDGDHGTLRPAAKSGPSTSFTGAGRSASWGFLIRLSGNAALAVHPTQETFVRVHRARAASRRAQAALPWMFAIARNAFLDHARREAVRRSSRAEARPAARGPRRHARGDEVYARPRDAGVVGATLATMPLLQREAFILIRFEGLSVSDAVQNSPGPPRRR